MARLASEGRRSIKEWQARINSIARQWLYIRLHRWQTTWMTKLQRQDGIDDIEDGSWHETNIILFIHTPVTTPVKRFILSCPSFPVSAAVPNKKTINQLIITG